MTFRTQHCNKSCDAQHSTVLNVAIMPSMLSVVMLNVVTLSVVDLARTIQIVKVVATEETLSLTTLTKC